MKCNIDVNGAVTVIIRVYNVNRVRAPVVAVGEGMYFISIVISIAHRTSKIPGRFR